MAMSLKFVIYCLEFGSSFIFGYLFIYSSDVIRTIVLLTVNTTDDPQVYVLDLNLYNSHNCFVARTRSNKWKPSYKHEIVTFRVIRKITFLLLARASARGKELGMDHKFLCKRHGSNCHSFDSMSFRSLFEQMKRWKMPLPFSQFVYLLFQRVRRNERVSANVSLQYIQYALYLYTKQATIRTHTHTNGTIHRDTYAHRQASGLRFLLAAYTNEAMQTNTQRELD